MALLRPTRLLISEKSASYTIKWSYTIIWQVRVPVRPPDPFKNGYLSHHLALLRPNCGRLKCKRLNDFSPRVYLWSCEVGKKYAAPNSYYMQPSSFAAASPRHK